MSDFNEVLKSKTIKVENLIKEYLPVEEGYQKTVIEAMNYSFLAGGKRLRPLMMQESYLFYGGNKKIVEPFMAALEMIHTYSLVHDDLPEMDNDELRRGMPTTHVKYGADMAVLAGDGLLNFAFETAMKSFDEALNSKDENNVNDSEKVILMERLVKALKVLATKAGIYGMIGGQTLDVEAEKKNFKLDMNEILFIDEYKTAALLQASLMIGGILAGASDEEVAKLEKIGRLLGIAFQIQDDILDITSTTEELGKPVGSDDRNNKVTYVSLMGLDQAKEEQKKYSGEAVHLLGLLNGIGDIHFLRELVESLVTRTK